MKEQRNFLGLEFIIRDKLDMKVGIMKTTSIFYRFNQLYNKKHENDDGAYQKSRALRFYTLGRYLTRNFGLE